MGVKVKTPIGEKFGKLTILEEVDHTYHPNGKMNRQVKVACECGSITIKALQSVKSGKQEACGLCRVGAVKDLSCVRVNRLLVTDKYSIVDGKTYWECNCDCGNTVVFSSPQLINARVHNCGECGTKLGVYYWGDKIKNREGYEFSLRSVIDRVATLVDDQGRTFEVGYGYLKNGTFHYPYHKSVVGVGYYGVGNFVAKVGGVHTKEYADWISMLKRCYKSEESKKTYKDKSVTQEWHNFQNFAEWAVDQMNFGREGWDLEKDLIIKNNKVYGPETCAYLPREINSFVKRKNLNGLPLGVDIAYNYDGSSYYRTQAREDGRNICLGRFYNLEEAFMSYKIHKEGLAKKLAVKWKDQIPEVAFNALYNYTVNITD